MPEIPPPITAMRFVPALVFSNGIGTFLIFILLSYAGGVQLDYI
jgi:hypothetical protein